MENDNPITTFAAAMLLPEDGVPDWVQLLPKGPHVPARDGRKPYRIDDAERVVRDSMTAGAGRLVMDYNHQTDYAAQPGVGGRAPAAGWIKELSARDDGIWGLVEWTPAAKAAVANREYRYVSPVVDHDVRGRVSRIVRAGPYYAITKWEPDYGSSHSLCGGGWGRRAGGQPRYRDR